MLNPLLLWFLPLAAVPIILHLITLYRLRTLELPTYRFLMDSYIQQRRKIKLLEFLLMILRTAFVMLIILAMSRPVLSRFGWLGGQSGKDVAIVIDAGASMGLRTGGTTSLERAQAAAKTIVNLLAKDDHVTIIRAGEKPEMLINRFANAPEPIVDEINRIKLGASGSNIAAALEDVYNTPAHGSRVVYVLSDSNRRAWSPLAGHPLTRVAGKDDQLVVMNVGPTEPVVNLAAIGEPPRAAHPIVGLPVLLSATVVNGSTNRPKDTVLTVSLDDQQITQVNVSLQPGQKVTKAITVTPTRSGVIKGKFQLPADAFPDDDAFLFCLNVEPKVNVVVVTPPPAPPPADPPDLFIRSALTSPLAAELGAGPLPVAPGAPPVVPGATDAQKIAASLDIASVVYSGLTDAMLATADVVILANVSMDPALGPRLRKFVSEGGGLIVFPGPNVQLDLYNNHLLDPIAGRPPNSPARAATLQAPIGNPDEEARFQPLVGIDLTHPILSAFAEQDAEYFGTARIYRYFPIVLPPTKSLLGANIPVESKPLVLMRLPDRTPMLIEEKIDEGRLLLAGFPASPEWSNVPLKPEFVPILLRAVAHVRRPLPAESPSTVKPREPAAIRITDRWIDARVEITDPSGKPATLKLQRSGRQLVGAATETDQKGYYSVRVMPRVTTPPAAGAPAAPERVDLGFAVNLDVSGADFAMMDEAQLRDTVKPMKLTYLQSSLDDPTLKTQLTEKREIWRSLIWVTFAVIGIEFLLATLRPVKARTSVGPPVAEVKQGRLRRFSAQVRDVFANAESQE